LPLPSSGSVRLFVGLDASPVASGPIPVDPDLPRARWVPSHNLHVTLAFLGDRPVAGVPAVAQQLAGLTLPRFTLHVGGRFDTFGRPPRILWMPAWGEHLDDLHREVRARLNEPEERDPIFHVTWARLNRPPPHRLRALLAQPVPVFQIDADRVHLYRSRRERTGSAYEVLATGYLAAARQS
jgi:2'-5' RNA ligase